MRKLLILAVVFLAQPVCAQVPAADAERTRTALLEVRILRALNAISLSPEQTGTVLPILEQWEAAAKTAAAATEEKLAAAAGALRSAVAAAAADSSAASEAEAVYRNILREERSRIEGGRRTARDELVKVLQRDLSEPQKEALFTLAREAMLEARLREERGRGAVRDVLEDLEELRQADPQEYARDRDRMAARMAGAFNTQAARDHFRQLRETRRSAGGGPGRRGAGPPPLPPITDPAIRQRAGQYSALFDRVRAMPPGVWQGRRAQLALQLARERESARVQGASAEEMLRAFAEEYLLTPRSAPALRARLGRMEQPGGAG